MTPAEHRERISATIRYARKKRLTVNVYLEDWSSGVRDSFNYVYAMVELLESLGVERIFPLHAKAVDKIEVLRSHHVRRAKLYFMRQRKGKAARLREKRTS